MARINQAVILAGGIGARLRPLTDYTPKPMILVNHRPFLEYLVDMLKENGISEIVLLLGYKHEKIVEHFGNGSKFGVKIKYSIGDVSLETGARIKKSEHLLKDHFLLMYCDNYWPLQIGRLTEFYNEQRALASVTVYANKFAITKNNMLVDGEGYVAKYDSTREDKNLNGVDIGFFIINKHLLKSMPSDNFSFEKEIIPSLIKKKQLRGYITNHRYYSIGTIEKMKITESFLRPRKPIFLDRDGVINKKPKKADYVKNWSEFEFIPGVLEAIKLLTEDGYEIYIVTNQAGVARRKMNEKDLEGIHANLVREVEKNGGKINGIYSCPHGWDENCECRKPKPGMFFLAAMEHNLNLTKSVFIGDDERDIQAGDAAGCRTFLVGGKNDLLIIVKTITHR